LPSLRTRARRNAVVASAGRRLVERGGLERLRRERDADLLAELAIVAFVGAW
jgi:hypothetical protein